MPLWKTDSSSTDMMPQFLSRSDLGTYRVQDCYAAPGGFYYIPERYNRPATGTITTATNSTTVTGTSTIFTTYKVGQYLVNTPTNNSSGTWGGRSIIGQIASIASDTSLTLVKNASVAVTTGAFGVIEGIQPELIVAISSMSAASTPTKSTPLPDRLGAVKVTGLSWNKTTKTVPAGSTLAVIVTLSEAVKLASGTPTLAVNNAQSVTYKSVDATGTKLRFDVVASASVGVAMTVNAASLGGVFSLTELSGNSPQSAITALSIPTKVTSAFRSITTA